jgi:hypothetical protein
LSWYIAWPVAVPNPPSIVSTNPTTSTSSTYYQDLYNKRKTTAETYKSENTALKKDNTRITKEITTLQKKQNTSKSSSKINSPWDTTITPIEINSLTVKWVQSKSSLTKKAPSTKTKPSSKSSSNSKTLTKSSKTSTKKSLSVSKTTKSSKIPTISTTSKAYVKLVDEHKLYKNYIWFVDWYLKSHLYTQYSSLGIAKMQKILSSSLKSIGKQQYFLISTWWTTWISIFDFNRQLWFVSQTKSPIDNIYTILFNHYRLFFSSISHNLTSVFLAKQISKDRLIGWKNLSKNDTWSDIIDTKISEMSFLPSE